jgi:D-alanyl-D-alanine endopeptidase (penicillin-binding protein 7)
MDKVLMKNKKNRSKLRIAIISTIGILTLLALGSNIVLTEMGSTPLPLGVKAKDFFNFSLPDSNISANMRLNLRSGIVIDNETQKVLYCYNADKMMPIASISKLLTSMVVLDNYRPDSIITITREDCLYSSRSTLRKNDRINVRDLLHISLIRSDNRAARAIARSVTLSTMEFAIKMNEKAKEIGLLNTIMYEPTGLDERNISTAADVAKLVNYASMYPEIARITSLKEYTFKAFNRKKPRRIINTNKLLFSKYHVLAGKTGYISESAYCLTTIVEDENRNKVTVVVLGAPGPQARFREARRLAAWAFKKLGRS